MSSVEMARAVDGPQRDASLALTFVPDDAAEGDDDLDVRLDWPSGVAEEPALDAPPSASAPSEPGRDAPADAPATRGVLPQLSEELTSLRGRIETIHQDIAGLVARVHMLGGAITGVEVALGDRLSEYSETVVQLGRGLTSNLSTYREGNDRTVADLRRALADSEELLRAVLTKADDLAVELAAVRSELRAAVPAAATTAADDEALDVDDLRTLVEEVVASFDVRDDVARLAEDLKAMADRVSASVAGASAPSGTAAVDSALQAELLTALEQMRTELEQLRRAESRPSRSRAGVEQALVSELEAMREEIAALKRRIAVRAKATGIDDEQIATIVEQVRAAIELRLPDDELVRVADAVATRFAENFEVVSEDDAPPDPAPERASRTSSRRR